MDSRFWGGESSEDVLFLIYGDREMRFIHTENRAAMGSVCTRQISSKKGHTRPPTGYPRNMPPYVIGERTHWRIDVPFSKCVVIAFNNLAKSG